ncbi:MATE family efflux transporter [Eubacterium sp. MSJ-21]|nr:MATE family efflux transporter [Eubacterium sp. MSJ-21]
MKAKSVSLTEGKILKSLVIFAIPILIGNIFQQLYNVADTAIIGNVLGDQALAAVGATSALYSLVIGFANGITNGFSVVLARVFGEKDEEKLKQTSALIYFLTVIISIILTLASVISLHSILVMLKTPENILPKTESYLHIILTFAIVTMLYNMFSGILRAIGDSKTPLYFLLLSSALNVGLDFLFVKGLNRGIGGAAEATVIAQIVSVSLCIVYIWKKCPVLKFSMRYLKWDKALVKELLLTGFSMGLMLVVVSIGSVALQSAVNSLGEQIIAAHTAARKIDEIFMMPLGTLATAAATFASQNFGAGKYDRVYKGIKDAVLIAIGWSACAILIVFAIGKYMVKWLTGTSDAEIISNALMYMKINIVFFLVLSILLVLRSSLQGVGRKIVPVLGSGVELILKFGAVNIITNRLGYFGVCILEPIIWGICAIMVLVDFVVYQKTYKKVQAVQPV